MASSSSEQQIYLGLPVELEPDKLYTLERHFLPLGKIGGFPAWLNPATVHQSEQLLCKQCSSPMVFLLQIYCTNPTDPPHAFHRMLYLFVCRKGECAKTNDASNFAVFRCQLPRQSPYYSPVEALNPVSVGNVPDPHFDANAYAKLCAVCGCRAGKRCAKCGRAMYCSKEHQAIDWRSVHREECSTPEQRDYSTLSGSEKLEIKQKHALTFREFGMEMVAADAEEMAETSDSEEDDDDAEGGVEENEEVIPLERLGGEDRRKLKEYEALAAANGVTAKDFEGLEEERKDVAYQRFHRVLEHEPEQVLRYQRGGQPLLATDFSPPPMEVPVCPICQQPRHFEFQLMPHLLTVIDVDSVQTKSLDWATLLVYTCQANCPVPEDGYAQEWAFKQDFVALPRDDEEGEQRSKKKKNKGQLC